MSPEQARGDAGGPGGGHLRARRRAVRDGRRAPAVRRAVERGVLAAILSEQPVPLVRLNPAIPPAFDELVHRMLAKEPERRPSAREVDDELAALLGRDTLIDAGRATAAARRARPSAARPSARELRRAYARVKDGQQPDPRRDRRGRASARRA